MALAHRSIAVESGIEFVNLQPLDVNPLMSKCEIKVFYLGKNRNHSFITKDVATEMAKSLRGAPIVGYYKEGKEDFADHGKQVILDDEGVHFNTLTVPYGFVSPDSKVWFQDFEEQDDFGNNVTRTYLMTTGYIWTGQFEEAKKIFEDGGKPHSMEIDEKTLQGHWAEDFNDNVGFFIISDAIFSKLCILGDDVEPCFEGSGITEPIISKDFTLDNNFKNTLFNMMNELKEVLKGDTDMPQDETFTEETQVEAEEAKTEFEESSDSSTDNSGESSNTESQETETEVEIETEVENENADSELIESTEESVEEQEEEESVTSKKELFELEENYKELQINYAALQNELTELKQTLENLSQFKHSVEDEQKDALIAKFFMLSDEDKKDVIEHKSEYSLEEIESKLAIIGFRKGVNFNYSENESDEENISTTFNLEGTEDNSLPDWVKAVKENEQ